MTYFAAKLELSTVSLEELPPDKTWLHSQTTELECLIDAYSLLVEMILHDSDILPMIL